MTTTERELKVAFIYNFIRFTEWPELAGDTLTLCIRGSDPFGATLDSLQGKAVASRTLLVQRRGNDSLKGCQAVFITTSAAMNSLTQVLAELRGKPVLTIADSLGGARQGVSLNMAVSLSKVTFEVNLQAARAVQLKLNAQLLRLATEVIQ